MSERVLILDDEEMVADLLGELFSLLGFERAVYHDPHRALRALEEGEFDVVVSDFRMPGMNGERFYNAAIEIRPELARRVVFMTGDVLSEDTQRFAAATGAPFITKPFDLGKVQALVRSLMQEAPLAS